MGYVFGIPVKWPKIDDGSLVSACVLYKYICRKILPLQEVWGIPETVPRFKAWGLGFYAPFVVRNEIHQMVWIKCLCARS